jgi:ATP-dependent 26S proteasome regulatory subunit
MSLFETISNHLKDTTKMSMFNYIKTNNPFIDTLISTIILTFIGYLLNFLMDQKFGIHDFNIEKIKGYIYKKNSIILEGTRSSITTAYSSVNHINSAYSDRFKAVWYNIIINIDTNPSIYKIKESFSTYDIECRNNKKQNSDIFIVTQKKYFKISENIYATCEITNQDDNSEKITSKTEKITIEIYSYTVPLYKLKDYINNITTKYLSTIKTSRLNKKFIYVLNKVKCEDEDSIYNCWRETEFISLRNFNNIFFDGKKELIKKIDFFLHNRNWYEEKGIPYTLGIGLYGPPGTGKTSLIKALANYTKSHIVFLSLKIIKTKQQLENFFFENTYNSNNEKGTITFDTKIIVIEDIDCIGNIVLKRENKYKNSDKNDDNLNGTKDDNVINYLLKSVIESNNNTDVKIQLPPSLTDNLITLDDILNLWDGICETPGRILIISSNHYEELDPALIRPGRIDITQKLDNASHTIISEMYTHFFGTEIDTEQLKKVNEYFYSPAEIVNIYISTKTEMGFMSRLLENTKI